jgi:hypothetical protein
MTRLLALLVLVACAPSDGDDESSGSESSSGGGEPVEPHVNFHGQVDLVDLCGPLSSQAVSFRAYKVGCATAGPCTIKTDPYQVYTGDAASCPGSQVSADMTVRVPDPAKYQIEARTLTDSGYQSRCYGAGGESTITVTAAQIEARATIEVATLGGPCPPP